jgi:dUTP pyrophosphatase
MPHGEGLELPAYETPGSAGMDLRAAVEIPLTIMPNCRELVPTGLILEIPPDHEVQIRPRSGLAFKHGITCLNTPGTIDSDYRGEIMVLLINHGQKSFVVERGMRIAQMIMAPCVQARLEPRLLAGETKRGSGGFGSTGV